MDLSTTLEQGCTELQPTDNSSLGKASGGFDASEAKRFLKLLGKDAAATWIRCIKPGRNGASEHQGLDSRWITRKNDEGFNLFAVVGNADAATGKGGGVLDADITDCPALFVEWDDGADIGTQAQRWQQLNLPEPTLMVATGGKSVHCYWVLREPMEPEPWRVLQRRLITYCKGDEACKNPSRLMRLPGSVYFDKKTGEPTGQCRIIAAIDDRYAAFDIEAALPSPAPAKPVTAAPKGQWEPRGIDEINAAAEYIPRRKGGDGTYPEDRNALCGCSAALAEAGHADPDGAALALLGHLWPSEAEARQVLKSTTTRDPRSFWAIAGEHGYDLSRRSAKPAKVVELRPSQQQRHKPARFTPKPDSGANWGKRRMGHTRRMQCLERCIEVQASRERNSLRRRARLQKVARDLELHQYINRDEIAQRVLEAKDTAQGNRFHALTAADRQAMERPMVRFLLPGILPANDMTILGGLAKVGKTRFAVAVVNAVIRGLGMLDMPAPSETKPVVLVTDDQADGDTADMLDNLQLWAHPQLIWSRNFRLTEHDIDALLATIAANPGALVVIDSLRSISRNLRHGENDPEIGATLYDLKQAVIDAGGTLLVIHHCNKAADLVGVEALSGHNAIAGAANTILTLHYLPGENGRPNKTAPERRLFREPRSGEGFDIVITRDSTAGGFRKLCSLSQWQQQAQEAKEASKRERVTPMQQQALDALQQAGNWMTRREVCDALGVEWGDRGKGAEPVKVDKALRRLVEIGSAESARSGTASSYRASCSAQETTETTETTSQANGFDLVSENGDNGDNGDNQSGTDWLPCLQLSPDTENGENAGCDSLAPLSPLSPPADRPQNWPAWGDQLLQLRSEHPDLIPAQLVNLLQAEHGITTTGRAVAQLLQQEAA
jgi:Fe2+ or Zn2+ uptake regulation protein